MNYNADSAPPTPKARNVPWWATGRAYRIQMRRDAIGLLNPVCADVSYCIADGAFSIRDITNAYTPSAYQGRSQDLYYELTVSVAFDDRLSDTLAKALRDIGVDCYGLLNAMSAATHELDGIEHDTVECVLLTSFPQVPKTMVSAVISTRNEI